jgi:hypothetical protein
MSIGNILMEHTELRGWECIHLASANFNRSFSDETLRERRSTLMVILTPRKGFAATVFLPGKERGQVRFLFLWVRPDLQSALRQPGPFRRNKTQPDHYLFRGWWTKKKRALSSAQTSEQNHVPRFDTELLCRQFGGELLDGLG